MKTQTTTNPPREAQLTTEQRVQQRAYDLYMKRGQKPGHELEDWLQAEREVRKEHEQKGNQQQRAQVY